VDAVARSYPTVDFACVDYAPGPPPMPANVAGGPSIVDGTVFIPYGTFDIDGGVVAYALPACRGDCNRNGAVSGMIEWQASASSNVRRNNVESQ
jgi:hypothetical protein